MGPSIVWFRRDLRLADHPALAAALSGSGRMLPVFFLDPRLLRGRYKSEPRTRFLLECLEDLDRSLRSLGSRLAVRAGVPERELPRMVRESGARAVHATAELSPFGERRDTATRRELRKLRAELHLHPGSFTVDDPSVIRSSAGRPYQVFTPFYRAWLDRPRRAVLAAPDRLPSLPEATPEDVIPSAGGLGLSGVLRNAPRGGEMPARNRATTFLQRRLASYAERRDMLDRDATSGLSPYLHFGCVSARELESRLVDNRGAAEFRRQLCWRDFYAHVLHASPSNLRLEHQARYRDSLEWDGSEDLLDAWRQGRTGYPIVDAAMRQLRTEGRLHNRARLIAGSFLTKDLGIDWRAGEAWFSRLLLDGDVASNNGNWQWIGSVGIDRQSVARRIYNPARQQARFDPSGSFVRRHVPELAFVPDEYLSEPWTMPTEVQEAAGCVIGRDYPQPVVEHTAARRAAIARYAAACTP